MTIEFPRGRMFIARVVARLAGVVCGVALKAATGTARWAAKGVRIA